MRPRGRFDTQPDMFDSTRGTVRRADWVPSEPPPLNGEEVIRLDFETTGLQWWADDRPVGLAYCLPQSGRRGYLPFGHTGGGNLDENLVKEWARRELRGVHLDNANTKFDVHMSRVWGVDFTELDMTFGDVAHRAALLDDHRFRFGIDQLAKDFLGEAFGKYDLELRDKGMLAKLPAWDVEPYAIQDVVLVDQLCAVMDPEIRAQELEAVHLLEQQVIPVVVEMEKNGAYLDADRLNQWYEQASAELQQTLWRIYKDTGVLMDSPDSPKSLLKIFQRCAIPITSWTDGGKPSFTGEVLAGIDHPVIKLVLRAAQLADLLSKYLRKYRQTMRSDGWIRYNLHQLRMGRDEEDKAGTVSGRFSSAGDDFGGINVQQVVSPKKQKDKHWCEEYVIRNLFKPAAGTSWLAVDADQIEYRIFAHFSGSEDLIGAYHAPPPYRTLTIGEESFFTSGPQTDYHAVVQEMLMRVKPNIKRKHTKITNFCKLFGSALIKFAFTLETITEQQFKNLNDTYAPGRWKGAPWGARERAMHDEPELAEAASIFSAYDEKFPSAKTTLKMARDVAKERGYVHTILGRRARFPNGQRLHSALNRVVQGTAADINKRVLVEVYQQRQALGLTLRMTVHDELDADLADESLLPQVKQVFNTQYIPLKVPILWSAEVGPSWGQAKKKA